MCKSGLAEMRQPIQGQIHAAIMLRLRQGLPRLTVDLPLYADATVHTPAQTRWLERPVDHESHVIGIHPYRNQNRLAGSDDMNVRRFHGGAVDSVVLDGNDCSFSTINSERHVESIAVPVVENAEKPIRGTTAVMRRPRFQSMHEHALHDIVIVKDEPSCLPPVAVRPPHAHDSGYDGDDRRRPSRPITNSNGRKHENDSKENLMNNEIRKFDFRGAALRTLTDEAGEPWFVAKDACDILGIDTNHLRDALDDDEITNLRNSEVWNQPGRAPLIISEPGLYKLIMRSRKPEAKEFQRWVTHEVLPQIRKTGGYIPTSESDSDEDIMARAVLVAQKTIKQKNQQIAEQQTRIVELEPKARFADAVAASDDTCLVGELAKMLLQNGIPVGQNRLFRLLRADGYLGKSGSNRNMPTQRAMELGLFRIKETTVTHADGHTTVSRTPKVTGKGQRYFIDRYWGRAQPSLEAGA
nr:MAG TPA: repressor domain protein [Caudoviricetes sp.]